MIESKPFSVEGLSKTELQARRRQSALSFFDALMTGEADAAEITRRAQNDPEYMNQVIDHLDAFTGIKLGIVDSEIPEPTVHPDIMDEYSRLMNKLDYMLGILQ